MLRLLTSSLLVALGSASFCGDSSVPFSLEILPDGQPVLGCARPSCFGWTNRGYPVSSSAYFNNINGREDGFVRPEPESIPSGPNDQFRPQRAVCERAYGSSSCSRSDQWVGGIAPLLNVTATPTFLQCCSLRHLSQSEDRGIAALHPGEIVIGGEVSSSGLQVGFDYIADLLKVVGDDGSLHYKASIRRMPCTDYAGYSKLKPNGGNAQAFQAPNVAVDYPIPPPRASDAAGNSVVEQYQQAAPQQANSYPLPPQQGPQPPQLQPVPFQAPVQAPAAQYYPTGGCNGCNSQFCFTGDMTVQLLGGGSKRMDELKKNDWVMAVSDKQVEYVPVDLWLHRIPEQEAEFNEFETSDGKTIKLTDKHYIFKGDCSSVANETVQPTTLPREAVTADQVAVGDCLFTVDKNNAVHEVRVVRAEKVTQKGIYAPMTSSGRILVNGIHASCHNIHQEHTTSHTLFEYVTLFHSIYDTIFGMDPDAIVETPAGLTTILEIADLIVPKNIVM